MAKRGKCVNIDCDHYKEEFDIQAGEEFVCPHCKQPLSDVEGKGKGSKKISDKKSPNWKSIGIIAAAVLISGGLGYGGYTFYKSHQLNEQKETEAQLKQKEEEETERLAREEEEARIKDIVASAKAKADSIIAANEKLLEEKGKKIREDAKKVINTQLTSLRSVCQTLQIENIALIDSMEVAINECWINAYKVNPTSNTGRNPSWGRYEGPRQNGLPNGSGILYINRTTTINGQKAQPGERIEGVFRNGYVNMGTWFKNDGNTVVVKDFKVL